MIVILVFEILLYFLGILIFCPTFVQCSKNAKLCSKVVVLKTWRFNEYRKVSSIAEFLAHCSYSRNVCGFKGASWLEGVCLLRGVALQRTRSWLQTRLLLLLPPGQFHTKISLFLESQTLSLSTKCNVYLGQHRCRPEVRVSTLWPAYWQWRHQTGASARNEH